MKRSASRFCLICEVPSVQEFFIVVRNFVQTPFLKLWRETGQKKINFTILRQTNDYIDGPSMMNYSVEPSFTVEDLLELCARDICVCSAWRLQYPQGDKVDTITGKMTLNAVFKKNKERYLYLVTDEGHVGMDVWLYNDDIYHSTQCLLPTQRVSDLKELFILVPDDRRRVRVKVQSTYFPNSRTMAELHILQGHKIIFSYPASILADSVDNVHLHLVVNHCFKENSREVTVSRSNTRELQEKLENLNLGEVNTLQLTIDGVTFPWSKTLTDIAGKLLVLMNDEEILVEQVQVEEVQQIGYSIQIAIGPQEITHRRRVYRQMCVSDLKRSILFTRHVPSCVIAIWHLGLCDGDNRRELKDDDLLVLRDGRLVVSNIVVKFYEKTVMMMTYPFIGNDNHLRPLGVNADTKIADLLERLHSGVQPADYTLRYKEKVVMDKNVANDENVILLSQVTDLDIVQVEKNNNAPNGNGNNARAEPVDQPVPEDAPLTGFREVE